MVVGHPLICGHSCLPLSFMAITFCGISLLLDSSLQRATGSMWKWINGDDVRLCRPVAGTRFGLLCDQDDPTVFRSFKGKGMCVLGVEHTRLEIQVFLNLFLLLNLVTVAHAQACLEILRDDLSAGRSSAMNERNCSEVGVYGGPRSLGGENQS